MKTLFILALLALAASSAFAQLDPYSQSYGQPWQQQPYLQPYLQPYQQPYLQPYQQPYLQPYQQQQPFQQAQLQYLQQQMTPCKVFLQQQCSPVTPRFILSRKLQVSSCQVMQQQCCQQLAQIPQHLWCPAISSVVQAIMQQQQHQFLGSYQPQQSQLEIINLAQNLPTMCNVFVPAYGSNITPCSITAATTIGGYY